MCESVFAHVCVCLRVCEFVCVCVFACKCVCFGLRACALACVCVCLHGAAISRSVGFSSLYWACVSVYA